jgi:hypothetical protein
MVPSSGPIYWNGLYCTLLCRKRHEHWTFPWNNVNYRRISYRSFSLYTVELHHPAFHVISRKCLYLLVQCACSFRLNYAILILLDKCLHLLKGHSHEKAFKIIPLNLRLGSNKFLKSPITPLWCFKRGGSRCKMGSSDLHEPTATRQQNSYMCRRGAPYSSSVTLYATHDWYPRSFTQHRCFTASC